MTKPAKQPATLPAFERNAEKIANDLDKCIGERIERLQTVLEDSGATYHREYDDDYEHFNPYPALCLVSLAASELETIRNELSGMCSLIHDMAS